MLDEIRKQAAQAARELVEQAKPARGEIFVVGCSSSEMVGRRIGQGSSLEAAEAAFEGIYPVLQEAGIYLAAQCCEHLNRAIVVPRAALPAGAPVAWVIPQPKAGGSFAATAWKRLPDPVVVESIQGALGMDIGGTLIGMHLRPVAVPVRLTLSKIGEAGLICARTRPKLIGGARAVYTEE